MTALALLVGVVAIVVLLILDHRAHAEVVEEQFPVDESPWEDWDWPIPDDNADWQWPAR